VHIYREYTRNLQNRKYKSAQLKKDKHSMKITKKIVSTMVFFNSGLNITFF